jgi:hypothetical protein
MKYLNKNIIYIIIILVFLTFIFFIINYFEQNKNNQEPSNNSNGGTSVEESNLSNRDVAIKEALANPDKLPRAEINGETYLLTGYDDVFYGKSRKENKPGWKDGGIIVFKLINNESTFFWESKEIINQGRPARFQDINSDGIKEIVWEYYLGVTGRDNCFYVYKFENSGFELITPLLTTTPSGSTWNYNTTLLCGDSGLTQMEDIDNDGVQEITVGDWIGAIGDNAGGKDIKIYKYDGDKYYLWK